MSGRPPLSGNEKQQAEPVFTRTNPFDSIDDSEVKPGSKPAASQSLHLGFLDSKARYKNDFGDSGGIEKQSVQELENYAVYKAEETTGKLNGCLKIAEEMREDASKTLVNLHQQGQQIIKTHQAVADIEHDLSRGEMLLGSLGGLFSKTWKPKKTRKIKGPLPASDDSFSKNNHLEQRQRLGLADPPSRSGLPQRFASEPASALERVENEKAKQDDVLSDLSNLLGELKNMAIGMGSEIDRQNMGLDHMQDDTDELTGRVKGANYRGRRLLGK